MLKKSYIALIESDLKLLVFILAMICLIVNQNSISEKVEEIEIENVLVEDFDSEPEEKSSSEEFTDDAFCEMYFLTLNSYANAQLELLKQNDIAVLANGFLIEVPLPPPEKL